MNRVPRRSLLIIALVFLSVVMLLRPLRPRGLDSHPRPARTYDEALERLGVLRAEGGAAVARECGTLVLTHGARTGRVVVLLHGLTNCPAQFDSLARMLFATGANVIVPRLPQHGLADHMTTALARSDARELATFTDRVVDAAQGLGDSVTVGGLSIGGVMAAWAGQERTDVDRAVAIAPLFGVTRAPGMWTPLVTRLTLVLPNIFLWWDDAKKQDLPGPQHVYPRFASRSIAATLLLGGAVQAAAGHAPAGARSLVMITVGGDIAADNGQCARMVQLWRAHGDHEVLTHEFPAALHLNHDVVDPEQIGGNPSITYPVLLHYLGR